MNIKDEIKSKDQQIRELKEEDKRLNQIIINLHEELKQYDKELRRRKAIIEMQSQIIDSYEELRKIITTEVK